MQYQIKDGALVIGHQNEILKLEAWGQDALRIRATENPHFTEHDWALSQEVPREQRHANIHINEEAGTATINNGRLKATINAACVLSFYRDDQLILREYFRSYFGTESNESRCLKIIGRDWQPIAGGDYGLTVRFDPNDGEKLFGMGQYQQKY